MIVTRKEEATMDEKEMEKMRDAHNRIARDISLELMSQVALAGGDVLIMVMVLESVCVGVLSTIVKPNEEADNTILDTMAVNIKVRVEQLREARQAAQAMMEKNLIGDTVN
jgi:hypothetical protein